MHPQGFDIATGCRGKVFSLNIWCCHHSSASLTISTPNCASITTQFGIGRTSSCLRSFQKNVSYVGQICAAVTNTAKKKKKTVQKERLFLLLPVLWVSTLALVDTLCLAQSDTATSRWQQSVPTVFSPLGSQEPRRNNKNTRWFSLYFHFWFCLVIHLFRGSHNDLMNCFPCYLFLSVNTQQSHKSMLLYFLGFPQPNQVHNPD